jgi:hypothetical protein
LRSHGPNWSKLGDIEFAKNVFTIIDEWIRAKKMCSWSESVRYRCSRSVDWMKPFPLKTKQGTRVTTQTHRKF